MKSMNLDRIIAVRNEKTIYRDGDACLKVFSPRTPFSGVLAEALRQERALECGLRVPPVRSVGRLDGRPVIVTDYIKGESLSRKIETGEITRHDAVLMLAKIANEIHEKKLPPLMRFSEKAERKIESAGFPASVCRALLSTLSSLPDGDSLCHGDTVPANILITPGGEPYILDWSHATEGDPAADIAATCLHFSVTAHPALSEEYADAACRDSEERRRVTLWLPVVAAARYTHAMAEERPALLSLISSALR